MRSKASSVCWRKRRPCPGSPNWLMRWVGTRPAIPACAWPISPRTRAPPSTPGCGNSPSTMRAASGMACARWLASSPDRRVPPATCKAWARKPIHTACAFCPPALRRRSARGPCRTVPAGRSPPRRKSCRPGGRAPPGLNPASSRRPLRRKAPRLPISPIFSAAGVRPKAWPCSPTAGPAPTGAFFHPPPIRPASPSIAWTAPPLRTSPTPWIRRTSSIPCPPP